MPDGWITHTGNGWFQGLYRLKDISLAATVTSTGEGAFYGCSFPKICLNDKANYTGGKAYSSQTVNIPNNVTSK
ncbi:MAG: leucine-rich repeat domain-containing protein [Dysgonamonadaceae bacterium]|nr:leucine-rich repeat domain-containing protein [Dysgonamonadaceae bacterium]